MIGGLFFGGLRDLGYCLDDSIWSLDLGELGVLPAWMIFFVGHVLDFGGFFLLGLWATDVELV